MVQKLKIIATLMIMAALSNCEKATDYYLGIPLQPEFEEDTYEEGMNLFALLRPDNLEEYNRSFVYMQEMSEILGEQHFSIIKGASVQVIDFSIPAVPDTVLFPLVPAGDVITDTLYRPISPFTPGPGNQYRLICRHPELPEASGSLWFPYPPKLVEGSLTRSGNTVDFQVSPDSLTGLIDLYYISEQGRGMLGRYVPEADRPTRIQAILPSGHTGVTLTVYAYDANLANYYANSNISLNINKYRTTISTLESGFGVFGAMNFSSIDLDD